MFHAEVLDLNTISECVRTLIEQIKCNFCGQKEGMRVRCACGVAACADCVPCPFCLTDPKPDILLTSRVKNVNHLLNVYANTFNTDVYTRLENLTRLKLERDLFPKCIQAPAKYYNKRKTEFGVIVGSRRNTLESFEKRLSCKDTNIFADNRGDNSNLGDSLAHVQEWLDTNAKMTSETKQRRPLSDFNENSRSIEQQSVSLRSNTISTIPQKRHLNPPDHRTFKKRPKLDEILPFAEYVIDENADQQTLRSNNNQNPSNCTIQPVPSDGMRFLVTAEIHAPPLIRKAHRNDGGDGGGGSEGGGSGGSTGSSDKENRDPNLGVRRGRGGGGGDDDDPTSRKRRRPLRQILRSRLGINCKQCYSKQK